ncbi:hypothetical protein [Rurimicrobium arvi]|uniref:DUF3575 domain-containing protein n=1 Tax=Rurimicrobium arvi TaxID=2049916 RepID=A0ABP8MRQ3_9BACT
MKYLFAFLLFVSGMSLSASAQEKIYLKNQKEPISCTVREIGTTEIKYTPSDAEQLVIAVPRNDVEKIVFKSGRTQYFTDPLNDFSYYKGQKKWAVKAGLFSPALGYTDLYLEKSIKPGRSIEFQGTIIGLGKNRTYYNSYTSYQNSNMNQRGFSVGVGYKVLKMPDFELANRKMMHILQGSYIKPSVSIGYYQKNFVTTDYTTGSYSLVRKGVVTSHIAIAFGKQWILDNTIAIDVYGMAGLGIDNYRSQQMKVQNEVNGPATYVSDDVVPYSNFGYTRFGRGSTGVTLGAGVKVGYLFNCKKPKEVGGIDKMRDRLKQ